MSSESGAPWHRPAPPQEPTVPAPRPQPPAAYRPAGTRRVIRSVDIYSVVRVAFAWSLSLWAVVLVGMVALYLLGLVSGGLGGVEGFIASLGVTGFRFTILPFVALFVVVALLASALLALLAAVAALVFNAVVPLVGGLVVDERERE